MSDVAEVLTEWMARWNKLEVAQAKELVRLTNHVGGIHEAQARRLGVETAMLVVLERIARRLESAVRYVPPKCGPPGSGGPLPGDVWTTDGWAKPSESTPAVCSKCRKPMDALPSACPEEDCPSGRGGLGSGIP